MLCMHCVVCNFFLKKLYCGLKCEVYWIVPAFSAPLCSVPSAASLLMCCPLCLMRTLIVCCGFQGKGENNFYRFSVRTWQNLFFQQCLLNDSSKNVYFNIYLLHDLYIFVINDWINFICCEITSLFTCHFSRKELKPKCLDKEGGNSVLWPQSVFR